MTHSSHSSFLLKLELLRLLQFPSLVMPCTQILTPLAIIKQQWGSIWLDTQRTFLLVSGRKPKNCSAHFVECLEWLHALCT
jgi:hypothetical protein